MTTITASEGIDQSLLGTNATRPLDMKLEIAVIPVSDVDRAKQFYSNLGWRLDADFATGDDFRVIQFTPPGSATSVIFGKNVTPAAPGSAQGLYLVVSDINAARNCSIAASRSASRSTKRVTRTEGRTSRTCSGGSASPVRTPSVAPTAHSPRSSIRMATAGCCRRSPRGRPDAWTRTRRRSLRWPIWRPRCAVPRPHTASTRSGCWPVCGMQTGRTGTPRTWSRSRPARNCRSDVRRRDGHRGIPVTGAINLLNPKWSAPP
jgi:bleomycin resistance family protein